jgi:hypothetical protein
MNRKTAQEKLAGADVNYPNSIEDELSVIRSDFQQLAS